jgi:hypothetical protein
MDLKQAILEKLSITQFTPESTILSALREQGFTGPPTQLNIALGELDTAGAVECQKQHHGRYRSYRKIVPVR